MTTNGQMDLAKIPSMTALLEAAGRDPRFAATPRALLTDAIRMVLDALRENIKANQAGAASESSPTALLDAVTLRLRARQSGRLRRVINATGVVLHTGLGRSALAELAVERLVEAATEACNLEIDLETGKRGSRGRYAEQLLCQLTGAEAALIVNNNAAATMLALRGMAAGREVVVSRGQLIEIGGSFRMPDVMAAGGAVLREVGTTNKTHLSDYAAAISERTAMIMHVHTSNYRVVGFAEAPGTSELSRLAHEHGLAMFDDLGSGALLDDELWTAAEEPTVTAALRAGADFVSFSGDKLLGGPQAGVLIGELKTIERLRRDPMARALRVDKLTLAALEATLELYLSPERARAEIPTLASLTEPVSSLTRRADALASLLRAAIPGESFTVAEDESFAGGGALPAWPLPTAVVRWSPKIGDGASRGAAASIDDISRRLRRGAPAILARIKDGAIVFDLRTIRDDHFAEISAAAYAAVVDDKAARS